MVKQDNKEKVFCFSQYFTFLAVDPIWQFSTIFSYKSDSNVYLFVSLTFKILSLTERSNGCHQVVLEVEVVSVGGRWRPVIPMLVFTVHLLNSQSVSSSGSGLSTILSEISVNTFIVQSSRIFMDCKKILISLAELRILQIYVKC